MHGERRGANITGQKTSPISTSGTGSTMLPVREGAGANVPSRIGHLSGGYDEVLSGNGIILLIGTWATKGKKDIFAPHSGIPGGIVHTIRLTDRCAYGIGKRIITQPNGRLLGCRRACADE